MKSMTKKIVFIALICAIAYVLALLIHFPIIPTVAFLKYDIKDVIIAIGGYVLGPIASTIATSITAVLEFILSRSGTREYGLIMNIISSIAFVLPAVLIAGKQKSVKRVYFGLGLGAIIMTAVMIPANILITPHFMGIEMDVLMTFMPGIILFNAIKGVSNAVLT
ncbi:MAG: ECF transporter S component, partial [Clostridia bacterium]|nr:ECF transporter S component [Clostridia bacterium]